MEVVMEVLLFAGLAFAINKTVSVLKALKNGETNTVVTQVLVWVVGFAGLTLAANADVASAFTLPGFTQALSDLDWPSLALLAWVFGSTGSFAYDLKAAIDGSDSAAETKLLDS
jgi:hypothetical protein